MYKFIEVAWQVLGVLVVTMVAVLFFFLAFSEKKVVQYELGTEGKINVNITNCSDETIPTHGMTREEIVNLINDLNKGLPGN